MKIHLATCRKSRPHHVLLLRGSLKIRVFRKPARPLGSAHLRLVSAWDLGLNPAWDFIMMLSVPRPRPQPSSWSLSSKRRVFGFPDSSSRPSNFSRLFRRSNVMLLVTKHPFALKRLNFPSRYIDRWIRRTWIPFGRLFWVYYIGICTFICTYLRKRLYIFTARILTIRIVPLHVSGFHP